MDLRRKIGELAGAHPGERISRVTLAVGAMSHLTEPALRARWEEMIRGTGAEGARLEVRWREDPTDPRAQGVVLESVGLEPAEAPTKAVSVR